MQQFPIAVERLRLLALLQQAAMLRQNVVLAPPDLTPAAPDGRNLCLQTASSLRVAVRNQGGMRAGPFSVRITYQDQTFEERRATEGLGVGQTLTFDFPRAQLIVGQPLSAAIWIDPYNEVQESNKQNNLASLPCTFA